ncbi:helical backbone metal receptor [Longimycelium tulufanense]|uniref:helical backbone metal receptor n=1 Tax=Longimycelium tulufanense TaxID=907463 RepID=UPI0016686AB2|nr:helical backbone metal receptor [Longimycelium tulufanense]
MLDDLGAEVPLQDPPSRVVSLVPSLTEAVALTVPGVLAGATDYCTHPSDLDIPRVGGSKYPKVQRVLALEPDLVLGNAEENRPGDVAELRAAGVPVWVTAAPATVPDALRSLRRLFAEVFGFPVVDWLAESERVWAEPEPLWANAIIPVWRKPWVVLGRDTFAGDVLRRLGVGNVYAEHEERYPRPRLPELQGFLTSGAADLVVLPDEPYLFTADDGPEAFPDARCALISGRHLTWHGPSLVEARELLSRSLRG